jgi:hypothetical protein
MLAGLRQIVLALLVIGIAIFAPGTSPDLDGMFGIFY